MREIYIVTSGEYSDKHNVAVCSTCEKAEALVAKIKEQDSSYWSENVDIEVFELDILADNLDIPWWEIIMDAEGNTTKVEKCDNPFGADFPYFVHHEGTFHTQVGADNAKLAIKVASERRFRLLAENQNDTA
jgi:hypothetical protein